MHETNVNHANKDQVTKIDKLNNETSSSSSNNDNITLENVICNCGQQRQKEITYSSQNSQLDESKFTVIRIDSEPIYYSPSILSRCPPESQVNQLTRSISESSLMQSNRFQSAGCLRKSSSKSPSGSYKCVRFTLNPSYDDSYFAKMDSKDRKWFDHLNRIKKSNLFSASRSHVAGNLNLNPGRRFSMAVKNSKKFKGRRKYLMHPSTVLLVLILIAIIICIYFAKRKKRNQVTEFNFFFSLA